MTITIRAKFENGVLKPLEKLNFKEGEEVIVEIHVPKREEGLRRFFGIVRNVDLELLEEEYYEYISERASLSR